MMMKRSKVILLIIIALLLGFGAAMGYCILEQKKLKEIITQIQRVNLENVYQLHEYRAVKGLSEQDEPEILFHVKIEQALPLRIQLSIMADALSRHCFYHLPIEVQGIQEYDGKKVAVVNLKEFDRFETGKIWHGASWAQGFFQGSAGGASTTYILRESFLQQENPMPWVDGVVFLYEEQPLRNFEHVAGLNQVIFRKTI